MRNKTLSLLIAGVLASPLGCGGGTESGHASKTKAVTVQVEPATFSQVKETYEATGTVRSKVTTTISSQTMGYVRSIGVNEGDLVKPGQLLIEIDDRDLAVRLRKARAGFEEAQNAQQEVEQAIRAAESAKAAAQAHRQLAVTTFQRFRVLLERTSVSQQEFDEVEAKQKAAVAEANRADEMLASLRARKAQVVAKIEQAEADVASAQITLSYTRVRSPIAGLVIMKNVDVGDLASPGRPLLTLEDPKTYRLETNVQESYLVDMHIGDEVTTIINSLGDLELKGSISRIVPAADPTTRTFVVKIALPANPLLRSGLFGKARFSIGQKRVIAIAATALIERGQLTGVYLVDETNRARFRIVKTGKRYGNRIEILSGLSDGERIVVADIERVHEGSRIREPGTVTREP